MRDPELLLSLLHEMADKPSGTIIVSAHLGMSREQQRRVHHVEFLVDAGHAAWTTEQQSISRITNAGYDFISAVEGNPSFKEQFLDWFNRGLQYAEAALRVVALVSKTT